MKPAAAKALLLAWLAVVMLLLSPLAMGLGGVRDVPGISASIDPVRLLRLSRNSLHTGAGACVVALVLAVPVALAAARLLRPRARAVLLALSSVPLFIPPTVVAVAAIRLFGPAGFLTRLLTGEVATFPVTEQIMGAAPRIPGAPIYSLSGGAFAAGWAFFPLAVLALTAALSRADTSAEEAALLHTSPLGVLRRITLPLGAAGLATGLALVFLFTITDLGIPEALRSIPVLVAEVYVQFGVYRDTQLALGASVMLLALGALFWIGIAWLVRRAGFSFSPQADAPETPSLFVESRAASLRMLRVTAWVLGALPALAAIAVLFATATGPGGRGALWRMVWNTAREEFWLTLGLGLMLAAATGLVGTMLGSALAALRRPIAWRFLVAVPLIVPSPVFGIAVPFLLRRPPGSLPLRLDDALAGLSETYLPLLAVWTLRFAPIVALLAEQSLRAIGREVRDLGRIEGAGAVAWWSHVAAPLAWPGIAAGMLIAFALSLGEVGAAVLLVPPGVTTLGVRLFTLMHWAPEGEVSVLCLLMIAPGLVAYALAVLLLRRR